MFRGSKMKTIEVTDEQYEFLKEAKELLNTQDNRSTRDPIYCIMEKKRIYRLSEDYASDSIWIKDDTEFETIKDLFEDVMENYEDELREYLQDYCDEFIFNEDNVLEQFKSELSGRYSITFEDFLEERDYRRVYYRDETKLSQSANIFSLFEVDAKEYVESKRSDRIFDYAESTWRSNRMSKLIEFLKELNI